MSDANPEKFLSEMRDAVQAFTQADPFFSDIQIINERLKDIEGKLDVSLGTLGGVAVVLVTPLVGGVLPNVAGANFRDIQFVARVLENVTINDTGKAALDVAVYLAALWCQAKPDTFAGALRPAQNVISLGNDPTFLSYDVTFLTEAGTKITIPKLSAVVASTMGADVALQLEEATPGAAIFYTLDGSPPIPRNPSAHLYTAPFAFTAGQPLRARAWLAGYTASDETKQTL